MSTSPRTISPVSLLGRVLPAPVKSALRPAQSLYRDLRFWARYGFPPPPRGTDWVGYEGLIEFCRSHHLLSVPGDIVEVGSFCGGGTYKLARFLLTRGSQKRVYAIDCFNIDLDQTENTDKMTMAQLYQASLKGKSQRQVFDQVTAGVPNILVIAGDSKAVELPAEAVCFCFIDGNHADDYVVNDFYLVWKKLSPGGVIAFHDYGYDLPGITATIDQLCARHAPEIARVHVDHYRHVIYLRKGVPELKCFPVA
jgi:hypothetical protein